MTRIPFLASALFSVAALLPAWSRSPAAGRPIAYQLDLSRPATHLIGVTVTIPDAAPATEIQFPAWNALYQFRYFARHVQDLRATCDGVNQRLIPVDFETWRTGPEPCSALEVRYGVYASDDDPFSCDLDEQHSLMNFAQLLFYLPDDRGRGARVRFVLPAGWKLATLLDGPDPAGDFTATNYDDLADSPAEAGGFEEYSYTQGGATYRLVVDGSPADYSAKRLLESARRITAEETALMHDVPFPRYTFILQFSSGGGGGMEHAKGTVIAFPALRLKSDWNAFEDTLAHEFFHLWNVKRIRPQGLEPVDYVHGNDTRDLWFAEGVTNTYAELTLLRAGLIDRATFYARVARAIGALERRPAREFQSAEESGMAAWFEGYRDYFRPERSISYYNKGELLGFLLDLRIRESSGNRHSLDDLMRRLNHDFAQRHRFFDDSDLVALAAELGGAGFDSKAFFHDYVQGTRELDYQAAFAGAGLHLEQSRAQEPDWGFETSRTFVGPIEVESVARGGNAERAGIEAGDEILTVNRQPLRVPPQLLQGVRPGQTVELEVRRGSRTRKLKLKLGTRTETGYRLEEMPDAAPQQIEIRNGWLEGKTE